MNELMMIIAGLLAGVIGSMGLGGGGILMLYLMTLDMSQKMAQGINLFFIIPVGMVGLFFHLKNGYLSLKTAGYVVCGGVIGVFGGSFVGTMVSDKLLRKIFALLFIILGVRELHTAYKLFTQQKNKTS